MRQRDIKQFMNGTINVHPVKLCLQGRVGWDASLIRPSISDYSIITYYSYTDVHTSDMNRICCSRPNIVCPQCKVCTEYGNNTFRNPDLDTRLRCGKCNKNIKACEWLCECGEPWHFCARHHCMPEWYRTQEYHPPQPAPANSFSRGIKRKAASASLSTHEELVPYVIKRISREACTLSKANANMRLAIDGCERPNISASFLSPKLRERFAHLVS